MREEETAPSLHTWDRKKDLCTGILWPWSLIRILPEPKTHCPRCLTNHTINSSDRLGKCVPLGPHVGSKRPSRSGRQEPMLWTGMGGATNYWKSTLSWCCCLMCHLMAEDSTEAFNINLLVKFIMSVWTIKKLISTYRVARSFIKHNIWWTFNVIITNNRRLPTENLPVTSGPDIMGLIPP